MPPSARARRSSKVSRTRPRPCGTDFDDTVGYFRDNDARAMADDLKSYVKSHPAQALIGAIAIGFFAGRMIRRP